MDILTALYAWLAFLAALTGVSIWWNVRETRRQFYTQRALERIRLMEQLRR
jgi:hypothetical protein